MGEGAWHGGVTWDPEFGNGSFTFRHFLNLTVSYDQLLNGRCGDQKITKIKVDIFYAFSENINEASCDFKHFCKN